MASFLIGRTLSSYDGKSFIKNIKRLAVIGLAVMIFLSIKNVIMFNHIQSDRLQTFLKEIPVTNVDIYQECYQGKWHQSDVATIELYKNGYCLDGGINKYNESKKGYLIIPMTSLSKYNIDGNILYKSEDYVLLFKQ